MSNREEFAKLREDCYAQAIAELESAGEQAVQYNIEHGEYQNVTGRLRRSNYYSVERQGEIPRKLVIGNTAPYASSVESRGKMVVTGGALLAHKLLTR